MTLQGKIALVTGASRGIGRAIAVALAAAGADVACAATEAAHCAAVVADVRALGRRAVALGGRVEQSAAVQALLGGAAQALGPPDILVNNAGISMVKPVVDLTEEDWERGMGIDAKSVFLCSQAMARQLIERRAAGSIINIGSIGGINAFPRRLVYCAAKAAVHHMTKVMAVEWAAHRIRVNAIAPGYIHTELTDDLERRGLLDVDALRRRTPQGQLGTGEDVGSLVVYLAGEESRYVTGSVLAIDGGWLAYGFT